MEESFIAFYTVPQFGDQPLAVATSFIYSLDGENWLVTAWHVATGKHPVTGALLSPDGGIPDSLAVVVPVILSPAGADGLIEYGWRIERVSLYDDSDLRIARYLWHPNRYQRVDVAAVPWSSGLASDGGEVAARAVTDERRRLNLEVAMDAFVLGYPKGLTDAGRLPIWKRASIASDPDVPALNPNLPPMVYIDTATRDGMSGAPVLVRRTGYLPIEAFDVGHQPAEPLLVGTATTFAGLYSGRVGADDELAAQLGIVWTEAAIREVIQGGQFADSPF